MQMFAALRRLGGWLRAEQIVRLLLHYPRLSPASLAKRIGCCEKLLRRQLDTLIAHGLVAREELPQRDFGRVEYAYFLAPGGWRELASRVDAFAARIPAPFAAGLGGAL